MIFPSPKTNVSVGTTDDDEEGTFGRLDVHMRVVAVQSHCWLRVPEDNILFNQLALSVHFGTRLSGDRIPRSLPASNPLERPYVLGGDDNRVEFPNIEH